MSEYDSETFDEIYGELILDLLDAPEFVCSPRGTKVHENLVTTITLTDPRERVIQNPHREWNAGMAVGEFLWYWSGRSDLAMMQYYNKRMKSFSDDGLTLNSAYGSRLRGPSFFSSQEERFVSQWETCIKTLLDDPDSRRAVMTINSSYDQFVAAYRGSKDVPCTLSLQFFIRDGALYLNTHMRSNDVIWGLAYDLFSFTLFQECMLLELRRFSKFANLELGHYIHTAGSMHLYERHFEMARKIVEWASPRGSVRSALKPRMEPLPSLSELTWLVEDEELLRTKKIDEINLTKYSGATKWMAQMLNDHRKKRDAE